MKSNNNRVTHGESFTSYSNFDNGYITYTPVYCEGHHVINITNKNRSEAARLLLQIRKNDYKFVCYHCHLKSAENNMFKFASEVKRLGWHYDNGKIEVYRCGSDIELMEFHGNIIEHSCSFHFRIYDIESVKQIAQDTGLKVTNYIFNEETRKYDKK